MDLTTQIVWLFVLAIPIACIAWTVTHEDVFREPRSYFVIKSQRGNTLFIRKFFYLLTCEFCFSHYVAILFLIITKFTLLFTDWRGYLISFFALVWTANIYMSLYALIKVDIKKERAITKKEESGLKGDSKFSETTRSPSGKVHASKIRDVKS